MDERTMRIGKAAGEAGVNIQTLRYYERRGLLADPDRTPAGHREYPIEAVQRVRFIKRAQELGFTLSKIEQLLVLRADRRSSCATVRSTARVKIHDIEQKIAALRAMKRALAILERSCATRRSKRACPLIESLEHPDVRRNPR